MRTGPNADIGGVRSTDPHGPKIPFKNKLLVRAWRFLAQDVWLVELGRMPRAKALLYKFLRVVYLTAHGFFEDKCLFRASALTYITALGLVPLLALGFSVAKGLGVYEKLRPRLQVGEPGSQSLDEAIASIFSFVENTDVRALGLPALAILLLAVVKLPRDGRALLQRHLGREQVAHPGAQVLRLPRDGHHRADLPGGRPSP